MDDSTIVRLSSFLGCVKCAMALPFATNADSCLEPLPILAHTSEPCRVVDIKSIIRRFVVIGNLIKKVQFECWTSCLDGSIIVRFGSLLRRVKGANVLLLAINGNP